MTALFLSITICTAQESNFLHLSMKEQRLKKIYINLEDRFDSQSPSDKRSSVENLLKNYEYESWIVLSQSINTRNIETINQFLSENKISIYAESISYTPVMYTGSFSSVFWWHSWSLLLDEYDQIDPLEFEGFPRTIFQVEKFLFDNKNLILKVTSPDFAYIPDTWHYIDARFVKMTWNPIARPRSRTIVLPTEEQMIQKLRSQVDKEYVWWWNSNVWIQKLLLWYRPKGTIDSKMRNKWILNWFDCSGLLFWATNGYTPRNTSNLVSFGSGLSISWSTIDEIHKELKPLDIIVWVGHNIIILDNDEAIESVVNFTTSWSYSEPNGVRIRTVHDVLEWILNTRLPVNSWKDPVPQWRKKFVIRRWQ